MGSTGTLDSPWHLADGVRATVPHRLASGVVVQLWRSGPEPHLHGWYEPAALFCHRLRVDGASPSVDLDELLFLGRVHLRAGGALFLYRHRRTGGDVLVDAHGTPHRAVADARRRAGHRFDVCSAADALAALLHPPARRSHPAGGGSGDGPAAACGSPGPTASDDGGDGPPDRRLAKVLVFRRRPVG